MAVFELIVFLLLAGSVLSLLAGRLGLPYPSLLAVAGLALAFVPGVPTATLDPSLALALFVAPVLLNAAYDTSLRDLRANWRPVAVLSVGLVCVTAASVALAARAVLPGLPWPEALALGAIVAPPDAAAATTVLRRLAPPHRLLVILEGESLLNDATALLIWRLSLAAAASGGLSWGQAVPAFLLTGVGSVLAGFTLGRLYLLLTRRIEDVAISVLLQFLATFSVWLLADRLGLSAIVTMVVYAITVAQQAPYSQSARARVASNAVWEVAVLGLSILAFIMMGLQLRGILHRAATHLPQFAGFALAVCATVILVRIVWVMAYNCLVRWKNRHFGADPRHKTMLPSSGTGLVASWCGMRGVVTLATALALPSGTGAGGFAYRDLLVFTAFCVVLATLVLQGMTLPMLLARLHLPGDDMVADEVRLARAETARAALSILKSDDYPEAALRRAYRARLRRARTGDASVDPPGLAMARSRAIAAERGVLARLRDTDRIGDAAFHRVEEELDWAEIDAESRTGEES